MASTKTVAEKLQVKPGSRVLVLGADAHRRALLDPMPDGATVLAGSRPDAVAVEDADGAADGAETAVEDADTPGDGARAAVDGAAGPGDGARAVIEGADVAVVFVEDRAALEAVAPDLLPRLTGARAPWIAYRKGGKSDIGRDTIAAYVGTLGWEPSAAASLDAEWSGLRIKPIR